MNGYNQMVRYIAPYLTATLRRAIHLEDSVAATQHGTDGCRRDACGTNNP
jgi:hypothetical protein